MPGEGPKAFLDTNVVLYVVSKDPAKAARAEALIDAGGLISVLVLNEIANVARRKMAMTWPEVRGLLDAIRGLLTVAPLTVELHDTGLALAERYGLSVYDSMIAAAALQGQCSTLWSEDMHHGLVIDDRLTIRDPFRD